MHLESSLPTIVEPVDAGTWSGRAVTSYRVQNSVGEAPAWHPTRKRLYWIDVRKQQLLELDPTTHCIVRWQLPEVVGAMGICADDDFCCGLVRTLVKLNIVTGALDVLATIDDEPQGNRLNDGKVSPSGRWFVFGSMDDRVAKEATGALYCASSDGGVRRLHHGLTICNGIAWNLAQDRLYFSDSAKGLLFCAPWNEATGEMGEVAVFATLDEAQGRPDGGAVDFADQYWSAGVSAGCVNILNAAGGLVEKIALPSRAPTMCTFGGDDGKTLFITSLIRPTWDAPGEHDGALLQIARTEPGPITPLFG